VPGALLLTAFVVAATVCTPARPYAVISEDEASYLLVAKAVRAGVGFTSTWTPGHPPYTRYPPGFPLVVAITISVLGDPLSAARAVTTVCTLLGLAAVVLWLRSLLGRRAALACAALVACSPLLWRLSGSALSEPLAQLLAITSLLSGERWGTTGRRRWAAAGLLAALLSTAVRVAGVALLAAWVLAMAVGRGGTTRRARLQGGIAAGCALLLSAGGWHLWTARGGEGGGEYARGLASSDFRDLDAPPASLGSLARRAAENAGRYAEGLSDATFHHFGKLGPLEWPARGAVLGLALLGAIVLGRSGRLLAPAWFLAHLAMCLLLPDYEGGRYIYPVLPVLIVCVWEGGRAILPHRARLTVGAVVLLILGGSALRVAVALGRAAPSVPPEMARYLHVARSLQWGPAVVVCRKPCVLALATGLSAVPYPFTRRPEAHLECLRSSGAQWVIVDELGTTASTFLVPVLPALPIVERPYFADEKTRAYRVP